MKKKETVENVKEIDLSNSDMADLNDNVPTSYVHIPTIFLDENVVALNEDWTEKYENDYYVNKGKKYNIDASKEYEFGY